MWEEDIVNDSGNPPVILLSRVLPSHIDSGRPLGSKDFVFCPLVPPPFQSYPLLNQGPLMSNTPHPYIAGPASHYEGSSTEDKAVLVSSNTSGPRTYAVHPINFPVTGWQLASQLNGAYESGYRRAQADMRAALGLKP